MADRRLRALGYPSFICDIIPDIIIASMDMCTILKNYTARQVGNKRSLHLHGVTCCKFM